MSDISDDDNVILSELSDDEDLSLFLKEKTSTTNVDVSSKIYDLCIIFISFIYFSFILSISKIKYYFFA